MPLTQKISNYIDNHVVGLRYGTNSENAAYGLTDIVGSGVDGKGDSKDQKEALKAFMANPNASIIEPRWDNRLWNTCAFIVALSKDGTVIIISNAEAVDERYLYKGKDPKGDGYTFRKKNRLSDSSKVLATIQYSGGSVQVLYDAVMGKLIELAG